MTGCFNIGVDLAKFNPTDTCQITRIEQGLFVYHSTRNEDDWHHAL